jgi:glycosyltransferase involved in cell wall biosynthesis
VSASPRSRILTLSRSYPSDAFPNLGLWVEQPTVRIAESCDVRVVAPVPYCPPVPNVGSLRRYARFRSVPGRERRYGIEVDRPRFLAGPGHSLYRWEAAAQYAGVRRTVDGIRREFDFDLIHAHFIYPEGAVAHRLSRRYGVPFIVTEHAPWSAEWFALPGVRAEALAAARDASAMVAVSTSVRETIVDYTGDQEQVQVIPVGVDAARFVPRPDGRRRPDQILYVGWLNYNKGVDVLLHAVDELRRHGRPGSLTLVGGSYFRDTQRQESELRRLAASLDLGDRVTFAGRLPQSEVAQLMAESAVVVLPSRAESFGAVLVEALACGTPVVATRCGGPEDIVTPEVGRLIEPGEPAALADAIHTVLSTPTDFPAERLRAYALDRFEWSRIVGELHDLYAEVTASPRASARGARADLEAVYPQWRA